MATTTSQDQTLDYQHFIDYQLTHAQGRMKSVEVGTSIVRLITATLAYVLAVIVLDHVFVLPSAVRLVFLLIALAAAIGYFALAVIVPGVRRINSFYTARTIEQATPEFKNSLINFLDLRRRPDAIPPGVLSLLEERAVDDLSRIQVDEKINHERLVRACYGLAGAVFVTCGAVLVNAVFMHRSLADSLGRALFPTAEIQPPTRTRLTDVKPGDKTVVAHTPVKISAIADGNLPDQVTLYWSDDGGKFWREQPMKNPESQFDPWWTEVLVEKPARYYLVGGDCRTREFALGVTPAPMITELELIYDYPEYTGWAQYTSRNGNIDALENTTITITATTNQPVASGQLRFGSSKGTGPAMLVVPGRTDQLTAPFPVSKDDTYVIWFETQDGETNPRPTSYEIKVRLDLKPTVTVKPGTDQVDPPVPANAIVPIGVTATDDFGIDEVKLNIARGQETLDSIDLTDEATPGKEFTTTHRLDLQRLQVAAGEEISYWVDVADNRQPTRNRESSPHYRIRLGSPLSPNEREDEVKRQVELAKADDAEKAAQSVQQPPSDATEPMPDSPQGDQKEPATEGGNTEPTPKDERAFDVIRKYLEEQERQEQTEKSRESDSPKDKQEGKTADGDESGGSKDSQGAAKHEGKEEGKEGDGSSKSESAEKPGDGKHDSSKPGSEKSAGGEQGDAKTGAKKPGTDKSDSEMTGKEKSDGDKPGREKSDGDKSGDSKQGTPGEKGTSSDKPDDDRSSEKTKDGQKPDSDNRAGSKPSGDKSDEPSAKTRGEKAKGEKSSDDKSAGDKPGLDKIGGEKSVGEKKDGEQRPTDSQAGTRVGGEKSDGEKPTRDKPGGDKPGGDDSAASKPGEKPGGEKPGNKDSHAKPGADKSDSAKSDGDRSSADKTDGDKPDEGKPSGDTPSGKKAGDEQPSSDKPGGGEKAGDKPSGNKQGGEKAGGEKAGGEKGGGEKSDGGKAGSGKSDGDKAGDSKDGSGESKGASQGKGSGKSSAQGKGTPGQGSSTGGGNNATPGQTEKPQPGGGPNQGKGPVTKNDDAPRDDAPPPRSPVPDYSNEGSELVLQRLSEQLDKGEVDPELLKRLGWTRDELEQFVKEFQGPGSTDSNQPNAAERQRAKKPTEPGKTTLDERRIKSTSRRPGQNVVDSQGENYEGRRTKPAPEYEDHVRAYNMSQSKSDKSASHPAGSKSP